MAKTKTAKKVLRGLGVVSIFGLAAAVAAGPIMEQYGYALDEFFGSKRQEVVTENTEEQNWIYQSDFHNVTEAVTKQREFAIREAPETYVLLKNNKSALPLKKNPKVSMFGVRSYAPVYGSNMGTKPDLNVVDDGNTAPEAYADRGIQLNPSLMNAYKEVQNTTGKTPVNAWTGERFTSNFGSSATQSLEVDIDTLASGYNADYSSYKDAAIVTISRNGGERTNLSVGGTDSTTTNILGLSQNEKKAIAEAKKVGGPVIVLINACNPMELKELEEDDGIDAILWIGFPGSYGFYGVADVLVGNQNPSGHLGDTFAANSAINPAMVSFGTSGGTKWDEKGVNGNNYLVNQEGIYSGYRYYETRYADVVMGKTGASSAKAGTYVNADTTVATTDGTWKYENEMVYTFGYGLSYTTFTQTLDSINVKANKKTAEVTVTVTNTGDTAGKDVVELYAQSPYTDYDVKYNVEKSAVQLMDYEKTKLLNPGESQTITLNVDMQNLASYDYTNAKTYIVDNGTYYFAIGDDAHVALNNILQAQGYDVEGTAANAKSWTWSDGKFGDTETKVDNITFASSKAGVKITNQVSDNNYSCMDINGFLPGSATYLTRNDWNGTYPKIVDNLKAGDSATIKKLLGSDFYEIHTNDDTSAFKWGVNAWDSTEGADNSKSIHFSEMAGAEWNDDRWDALVDQLTIKEFLDFAQKAMHNVGALPGVGYGGQSADDGPGGSDSHTMKEGTYQGKPFTEMSDWDEKYANYGTRVFPAPLNLAYSWNKELEYENGQKVIGETGLIFELPIMIGPGMNIHRHGYNARGFEYYSEDPVLSGFTGSAVTQGAQSLGCMVNIKHFAFNDQENDRDGVAPFMNEQAARELELRNFQQAFEANGKPAAWVNNEDHANDYTVGALGVMTSFNRLGATAVGANEGVMQNILRGEWDFKGYCVTDFSQVSPKAAPKESIQFGTTAFCGSSVNKAITYWNEESLKNDANICAAIKLDLKYNMYALSHSLAMNGYNTSTHTVQLDTPWRQLYKGLQIGFGISTGLILAGWIALEVTELLTNKNKEEN